MPTPLLLLKPDGSRDRAGSVTPTITGDVPVVTVGGQSAWSVWEGTTNALINPSMEVATGAYTPRGTVSAARSTLQARNGGAASLLVSGDGAITAQGFNSGSTEVTVVDGQTWTGSAYVLGTGPFRIGLVERTAAGAYIRESWSLATTVNGLDSNGEWPRISCTTTMGATAERLNISIERTIAGGPWSAYFDDIQLEQKAYATPFCPRYSGGVLQSGNVWNGTAHASTSTRTAGSIALLAAKMTPLFPVERGSTLIRYVRTAAASVARAYRFGPASVAAPHSIIVNASGGVATGMFWFTEAATATANAAGETVGQVAVAYSMWDGDNIQHQINASKSPVVTRPARTGTISGTDFYIGSGSTVSQQLDGTISHFVLYDRPLTDAELTRAFAAMAAGSFGWGTLNRRDSLTQTIGLGVRTF